MVFENTLKFAQEQDRNDPLKKFRERFLFPQFNGKNVIYFCGNSLGLQPKPVKKYIQQELDAWEKFAVEAHFKSANPWFAYHEQFAKPLAEIVGALPEEVVAMNQLTVNLHLMLVSFYRPSKQRCKIITEYRPFPSDSYALESQVKFHNFEPDDAIIELQPRIGEHCLRMEDILSSVEKNKDSLALVMFGGVNYYTGQAYDMKKIAEVAHNAGALCGFDLAHAAGNMKMNLHDWNVDFACWCSYKYLNSGPGGVAGVFIHKNHANNTLLPRFAGWWGHDKTTRFKMEKGFKPIPTAEGWQLSNVPVLAMAAHKASLDIFEEAGMDALIEKSKKLTGYLEFVVEEINKKSSKGNWKLEIITPNNKNERGCQLSIIAHGCGKNLFEQLSANGIIADWREPNPEKNIATGVIRVAPVPLYNSFEDVFRFGELLRFTIYNLQSA